MAGKPWEQFQNSQPAQVAPAAKPWEKFQATPAAPKPWEKFQAPAAGAGVGELGQKAESEHNLVWSDTTTDDELVGIAQKHGVDPQYLKDVAGYFGASRSDASPSELLKQGVGFAGEAAGLGLPQKLYALTQDDKHQAALADLSKLADEKKSYLRMGSEFLAPGLGTIGAIGKGVKAGAMTGAAIGGISGFSHSAPGEELKGTGIGAAGGAALGAAIPAVAGKLGAMKQAKLASMGEQAAGRKAGPELQRAIESKLSAGEQATIDAEKAALKGDIEPLTQTIDINSSEFHVLQDLFPHKSVDELREIAATNKTVANRDRIAKKLGSETWEQAVKEQGGVDRLAEVHQMNREVDVAKAVAEEGNLQVDRKLTGAENLILKLPAANEVAKIADSRTGLGFEQIIAEGSEKLARASNWKNEDARAFGAFQDFAKKYGVTERNFDDMFTTGNLPAEVKAEWSKFTDGILNRMNERGAMIEKRADYARQQAVKPDELAGVFKKQLNSLEANFKEPGLDTITPDQYKLLSNTPDFQEFTRGLKIATGREIESARDFSNAYNSILRGEAKPIGVGRYTSISAAKERTGSIPDFMREKNQFKAMRDYINNVNNSLATRDTILKLEAEAEKAQAVGEDGLAKYFRTVAEDMKGKRQGTLAAATSELGRKWKTHFISKGNQAMADLPDVIGLARESMYANVLGGLNATASVQNLLTPGLSVIPDLGAAGAKHMLQSLGKSARDVAMNPKQLEKMLAEKGLTPASFDAAATKVLQGQGYSRNQITKFNQWWSSIFQKSELAARAQVYHLGQDLGAEIAANPNFGRQVISRLNSPSYRRTMQQALDRGDIAGVQSQLTQYLNSNHLLNYDKANQAQVIRSLGPLFSAFTRWPTATAGKVLSEYYDKPAMQASAGVARRMLAPLIMLHVADQYVRGPEENRKGISRVILGKDLGELSPAAALSPKAVERFGQAPGPIKAGYQMGQAIVAGDADKVKRILTGSVSSYLPFIGAMTSTARNIDKIKGEK